MAKIRNKKTGEIKEVSDKELTKYGLGGSVDMAKNGKKIKMKLKKALYGNEVNNIGNTQLVGNNTEDIDYAQLYAGDNYENPKFTTQNGFAQLPQNQPLKQMVAGYDTQYNQPSQLTEPTFNSTTQRYDYGNPPVNSQNNNSTFTPHNSVSGLSQNFQKIGSGAQKMAKGDWKGAISDWGGTEFELAKGFSNIAVAQKTNRRLEKNQADLLKKSLTQPYLNDYNDNQFGYSKVPLSKYGIKLPKANYGIPSKFEGKTHAEGGEPINTNMQFNNANDLKTPRHLANLEVETDEYLLPQAELGTQEPSMGVLSAKKRVGFTMKAKNGKNIKVSPSEAVDEMAKIEGIPTPDKMNKYISKREKFIKDNKNFTTSDTQNAIDILLPQYKAKIDPITNLAFNLQEQRKEELGISDAPQAKFGGKAGKFKMPMAKDGWEEAWTKKILEHERKAGAPGGKPFTSGYDDADWTGSNSAKFEKYIDAVKAEVPRFNELPDEVKVQLVDYKFNTGRNTQDLLLLSNEEFSIDQMSNLSHEDMVKQFDKEYADQGGNWEKALAEVSDRFINKENSYYKNNYKSKLKHAKEDVYMNTHKNDADFQENFDKNWFPRTRMWDNLDNTQQVAQQPIAQITQNPYNIQPDKRKLDPTYSKMGLQQTPTGVKYEPLTPQQINKWSNLETSLNLAHPNGIPFSDNAQGYYKDASGKPITDKQLLTNVGYQEQYYDDQLETPEGRQELAKMWQEKGKTLKGKGLSVATDNLTKLNDAELYDKLNSLRPAYLDTYPKVRIGEKYYNPNRTVNIKGKAPQVPASSYEIPKITPEAGAKGKGKNPNMQFIPTLAFNEPYLLSPEPLWQETPNLVDYRSPDIEKNLLENRKIASMLGKGSSPINKANLFGKLTEANNQVYGNAFNTMQQGKQAVDQFNAQTLQGLQQRNIGNAGNFWDRVSRGRGNLATQQLMDRQQLNENFGDLTHQQMTQDYLSNIYDTSGITPDLSGNYIQPTNTKKKKSYGGKVKLNVKKKNK